MAKKIICFITMFMLALNFVSAYTIEDNSVVLNDSKAYFKTTPHTLSGSGIVYQELKSKVFSGDIDFAIGVNTDNASLKWFEINKLVYNAENDTYVDTWVRYNNPTIVNHEFDGKNKWYVAKNVNIEADKLYQSRFYLKVKGSGKYDVAFKPSSETISQAIANNHLYFIDPWWNETEYISQQNNFTNYWEELDDGTSTAHAREIYLFEDSLVDSWFMEDVTSSIGKYNTTNTGATYTSNCIIGGCYNFTVTSSAFESNEAGLNPVNNFSFSVWGKKLDSDGFMILSATADYGTNQNNGFGVDSYLDGVRFILAHTNNVNRYILSTTSTGVWSDNDWHHLVITKSSSDGMAIYLDGVLNNSEADYTNDVYYDATSDYFLIGNYRNDAEPLLSSFRGLIDEVLFYDKPLNATEVAALYNSGSGRRFEEVRLQSDYLYSDNLVEAWFFENNTLGELYNYSGVNNGATYTSSGKIGGAYSFSGSQSLTSSDIDFTTELTINAWVYLDDDSGGLDFLVTGADTTASEIEYRLTINGNNKVWNWIGRSTSPYYDQIVGNTALNLSEWTMVSLVFNGSDNNLSAWVNGVYDGSVATVDSSITDEDKDLKIGWENTGTHDLDGDLDEIIIWDKALGADDMATLYNSGAGARYDTTANEFYSKINDTNSSVNWIYPTINCTENGGDCQVRVSADNKTSWSSWLNESNNNQNISVAQGDSLTFEVKINGTKTTTAYLTGFGILSGYSPTSSNESVARTAIETVVANALDTSTSYYDQKVYTYNGDHNLGIFDLFIVSGSQRWAFNYISDGDNYTNMSSIGTTLNVWENASLTSEEITKQVEAFINSTKD